MQHTATRLQHAATRCNTLQHHRNLVEDQNAQVTQSCVLQCIGGCVMQCVVVCCNTLQCNVAVNVAVQCCGALQFVAACCQVPRRGSKCAGHAWGPVQSRLAAVARLQFFFSSFLFIWLFFYNIGMHSHKYKGLARAMTTRYRYPPFFWILLGNIGMNSQKYEGNARAVTTRYRCLPALLGLGCTEFCFVILAWISTIVRHTQEGVRPACCCVHPLVWCPHFE